MIFSAIWIAWGAAFALFEGAAVLLKQETLSHFIVAHSPVFLTLGVLTYLVFHFASLYLK